MAVAVVLLIVCVLACGIYIGGLKRQLRSLNRQLEKRLREHSREPLSLELFDKDLSALAADINRCLRTEEMLRIESLRGEKRFKEMISNISHDLRTPLTAIKGYQQLIEKDSLTADQLVKLRTAQKHAGDLGLLIDRLFEYSYAVTGGVKPELTRLELTRLAAEGLADAVEAFEARGIAAVLDAPSPVYICGDPEMTGRIIRNLIANCAAYSAGDVTVSVRPLPERQALLALSNPLAPGTALQPERLFDRFYTGDQARSGAAGTGLGLHIVQLLARQMGGSAGASAEPGAIEIWVKLPLAADSPR